MLIVKQLTKTIRGETLFKDVSFILSGSTKVALIGPNGCGKSTLLKILMHETDHDGGRIQLENERLGYLPQELYFTPKTSIRDFVASLETDSVKKHDIEAILYHLGLTQYAPTQMIESLSEGQKMKFALARALADKPSILLLDEPTNHLDIEGIIWFESFIRSFEGAVLMISHDRRFIDNTVDQIFEFDEQMLHIFVGNYTAYKEQKQIWLEKREIAYKSQERKRQQLERLLENARKVKDGKSRGKRVKSAKKRMEREVLTQEISKYDEYVIQGISFSGSVHRHKRMITVNSLGHSYSKKSVFEGLTFELRGHERMWIYGPNGCGKTTLLQILTNRITPSRGNALIGENVHWGYFEQNQKHMPLEQTVEDFITQNTPVSHSAIYGFLSKLSFPRDYLTRKLKNLSPGERARLSLGVFTREEYGLLILDEPTNHLDIWTKEAVESALRDFKGSLLLVSHDRYFVEQVGVHKMLNLKTGTSLTL